MNGDNLGGKGMRNVILAVAVAAVLAPIAAVAAPPTQATTNASKTCKALRANMGAQAFNATFRSLGACVSRVTPIEEQNVQSAESACRAEQNDPTFPVTHGGKSFNAFYGQNDNDKNAFGKCVSLKTQASHGVEQPALNPARSCRALKSTMGASTFAMAFGTNATHRNAFGKCASLVARTGITALLNAAQACTTEQNDTAFPAAHGGKTFAQFYGTNADLSNAFGNCVAQKALATLQKQGQALVNAAKSCRAALKADPTAFRQKYGTKPNAFAKCVSAKTRS